MQASFRLRIPPTLQEVTSEGDSVLLASCSHAQVLDRESYASINQLALASPAEFWEPVAQRVLSWYHAGLEAWLR